MKSEILDKFKAVPYSHLDVVKRQAFNKYQFEIIFIDDCSTDNSWDFIEQLKQEQKDIHIQAIRLNKNFGQHNAILCGLRFSSADYVITMDDDMEVLPSEMVKAYIRCV